MKKFFYITNEAAGGAHPVPKQTAARPKTKRLVPGRDNNFGHLCTNVAASWQEHPNITLGYITQAQFAARVAAYNNFLHQRQHGGGQRSPLTLQLVQADRQMDLGIRAIKHYLYEKYEQEAVAYYPSFGMEHKKRGYSLPYDRNKRKAILAQIQLSIVKEGLGDKKYGAAFWQALEVEYTALVEKATYRDGQLSVNVGSKNLLKAELSKVLNSLIAVIRGNYCEMAPAQLRHWGFQKDKY